MYSNILILSLLLIGVLFVPPTCGQITFSRSWVPQGKRSSSPDMVGDRTLEVGGHADSQALRDALAEGRREARLAALAQVAANIADLIEETSESDAMLALRLRNALTHRNRRSV